MRVSFSVIVLCVLHMLCFDSMTDAASIHGVVVDDNNEPVSGVVVEIVTLAMSDTTDTAGLFDFDSIAPGTYGLYLTKPYSPFIPKQVQLDISGDDTDPVVIQLPYRSYTVDEIVVYSPPSLLSEQQEKNPSQVEIVTRAEFERTALTVEDVIMSTPSASISSYGGLGSFSEVSLRGSYSNQVYVYIDGMLLNESIGGSVNLGLIPLTNVERIEIWRSGAPAHFGGDAIGGAINIVTRDYSDRKGSVALGYGSFDTYTGQGIIGFGSPESRLMVTLDAASSRNSFDYTSNNGTPLYTGDDYTTYRRNNAFQTVNGLAKYRRVIGADVILELSEHLMYSLNEIPSTQHILYSHASLATTKNLFQSRLSWMPQRHPWLEMNPTVHAILSREQYEDKENKVGWGAQDNVYLTGTYKGMLPITVRNGKFGSLTITPVVAYESYDPEHRLERTIPLSCNREQTGVVSDIEFHFPNNRFIATANIRRDRYYSTYDGQPNPVTPYTPEPLYHYVTNSQSGVKIEPHHLVSFKWNYSDNWRIPSFYELFGDRGSVVAKPGLQPEHAYRWDAGVQMTLPKWSGRIAGTIDVVRFDTVYRNLIQWYSNSYGFIEPANVPGSYLKGTELIWNIRVTKSLNVQGNWTFQKSKVTEAAKVYYAGKKLPNRPEQYGSVMLEYISNRATMAWIIDHKDAYYLDRSNQSHMKYPGRTLHDVCLTFGFGERNLVWKVMIENITNKKTFDMLGMPKPGRSYTLNLQYSL